MKHSIKQHKDPHPVSHNRKETQDFNSHAYVLKSSTAHILGHLHTGRAHTIH